MQYHPETGALIACAGIIERLNNLYVVTVYLHFNISLVALLSPVLMILIPGSIYQYTVDSIYQK